jgi:hypothetical protein
VFLKYFSKNYEYIFIVLYASDDKVLVFFALVKNLKFTQKIVISLTIFIKYNRLSISIFITQC